MTIGHRPRRCLRQGTVARDLQGGDQMNEYELAKLEAQQLLSSLRGDGLARSKRLTQALRLVCLVAGIEFVVIVLGAILVF
jgi:hypothetical protein